MSGSRISEGTQAPLLELRDVRKAFRHGHGIRQVLDGVNLEVRPGSAAVGVWGERGEGRTTLLRIAAGLLDPDSGEVRFCGRNLAELSERQRDRLRRGEIGWVGSEPPEDDLAMGEWIALPLYHQYHRGHALHLAEQMLEQVGASGCHARRWHELTDGERTLAGIAHALIRAPALLIADDPMRALPPLERERVATMLQRLAQRQRIGMLLSAPDLASLSYTDWGTLTGGRLLFSDASSNAPCTCSDASASAPHRDRPRAEDERASGNVIDLPRRRTG
jgi:ABC-type lipoprotein export system ATPase subunit